MLNPEISVSPHHLSVNVQYEEIQDSEPPSESPQVGEEISLEKRILH